MKKTLILIMAISMVLSMTVPCFAELSSYSKSPTQQEAPKIVDIELDPVAGEDAPEIDVVKKESGEITFYTKDGDGPAADDCLVTLKVTPFVERDAIETVVCKVTDGTSTTGEVSAEDRLLYAKTNSKNGTDDMGADNFKGWREIIDEAATEKITGAPEAKERIKDKDIVIVTIFDVSVWCEKPATHNLGEHHCVHTIRLTFGDEEMTSLLNNYVALMHFNRAGEWEYIPSKLYEQTKNGETVVEFTIDCDNLSPFALAAYSSESSSGDNPVSPQTGDMMTPIYAGCAVVFGILCVAFLIKSKKEN